MNSENKVIVICGPTASGKTALSLQLACSDCFSTKAEIVSADSMQIYRGFDIGTAKVSSEERSLVKHHMIDICDPSEYFSVAQYKKLATEIIHDIQKRGKQAIICGGTGQYLSALIDGLEFIDVPVDTALRENLNSRADQIGMTKMLAELAKMDPQTAERLAPADRKRIIRAHEVIAATGLTPTEINRRSRLKGPDFVFKSFCLAPDRKLLYERINTRVIEMFEDGWIEETKNLLKQGLSYDATSLQAIGYRQIIEYLQGLKTKEDIIAEIQQATRRYAKRQLTWFRRMEGLKWLESPNLKEILN